MTSNFTRAGTSTFPTNASTQVFAYKANRFTGPPADGDAPPVGSPNAGPVYTTSTGAWQISVPTNEDYYVTVSVNGTNYWFSSPTATFADVDGETLQLTGTLDMNAQRGINCPDPIDPLDVVNKEYADGLAPGLGGACGVSGVPGAAGACGVSGVAGAAGACGVSGTTGACGASGAAGVAGACGVSGTAGACGVGGTAGACGVSGTAGTAGACGVSGTTGAAGWPATAHAVTVTTNAGTTSATYWYNNFTNSSASNMTITMGVSGPTPSDGQAMIVRIYDASGVTKAITWVNTETSEHLTAPTTSAGSTTIPLCVGFIYNGVTSLWTCVAVA